ncbi:MAG: addiction module antidote protein, HigA family [Gammaproteobacteria bacterium]|nr:MAG: addiction module antidote protein, HigA family [Gammaproteobacteria bacterium]
MPCQHPGKVLLQQYLEPQKISQNRLARAIKVPPRRINEIIHEKRSITADTAVRLAIYFGGSATYWLHLQSEFEIEKVKQNIIIQLSTIQTPLIPEPKSSHKATSSNKNSIKRRIMR